jgi:actin-related protein
MAGALEGDVFIGRRAQEFRGLLKIKYPMEHGIVTDWDDMERIWNWVYAEELGTLSEEVRSCVQNPAAAHLVALTLTGINHSIRCCSQKLH